MQERVKSQLRFRNLDRNFFNLSVRNFSDKPLKHRFTWKHFSEFFWCTSGRKFVELTSHLDFYDRNKSMSFELFLPYFLFIYNFSTEQKRVFFLSSYISPDCTFNTMVRFDIFIHFFLLPKHNDILFIYFFVLMNNIFCFLCKIMIALKKCKVLFVQRMHKICFLISQLLRKNSKKKSKSFIDRKFHFLFQESF